MGAMAQFCFEHVFRAPSTEVVFAAYRSIASGTPEPINAVLA